MSNKELCISIINEINELDDEDLSGIAIMLEAIKKMLDEITDDAFCLKMYEDYLNDDSPDKHEAISLEDYADELGITLA